MTYSYMQLSESLIDQLEEELRYRFGTVLDIEVIELDDSSEFDDGNHFAVAFAAVAMRQKDRPVEGVVCQLKKCPDDTPSECLMATIHESEGPTACFCPTEILYKLTPTRDVVSLSWRKRCSTLNGWEYDDWVERTLDEFTY